MYVPFLVDLFQDKGNVCFGLLNGTEINHGSTIIVGGIDDLSALTLELFLVAHFDQSHYLLEVGTADIVKLWMIPSCCSM